MSISDTLLQLYKEWSGTPAERILPLPQSGSERLYFRIYCNKNTVIGAYSPNLADNKAFFYLTDHFRKNSLPVPEIYRIDSSQSFYLLQDLGDTSVFSLIQKMQKEGATDLEYEKLLLPVMEKLADFQIKSAQGMDYTHCMGRPVFDQTAMMWDLNYFKYYFLKLSGISFDENLLEKDFNSFSIFLSQADQDFFMYRDFQSRNVMMYENQPWFIDYQGGRKGALPYDVVSFLYQARASFSQSLRNSLIEGYIKNASKYPAFNEIEFRNYFEAFVFIRLLQVLGAYGFRGYIEKKSHFIESIPFAIKNLEAFLASWSLKTELPELRKVLENMVSNHNSEALKNILQTHGLTIRIQSFSYKKGIPADPSGNGGGFVFDCRGLHNPGRYEEYKTLTGKDKPVMDFLEKEGETKGFLSNIFSITDPVIQKYQERDFNHLMISFGCTGGQHRSVYCAERTADHIRTTFPDATVLLFHTMMG